MSTNVCGVRKVVSNYLSLNLIVDVGRYGAMARAAGVGAAKHRRIPLSGDRCHVIARIDRAMKAAPKVVGEPVVGLVNMFTAGKNPKAHRRCRMEVRFTNFSPF